ncbi:DivIVA domain-containing protein [Ornithinicoccus halotolerans]|uniref:DivIVA domain-containing protein n=1 Tax=Ornithinicoccus halotolerans TaxID=1748220 RepID=UPI00129671A3|nr:DivIVA domain-containing protein [Ornithinicoccus halotolerans]
MVLLLLLLAVLLAGLALAALAGRLPVPGVPPPVTTESAPPPPSGSVRAEDLAQARFDLALRGYRMSQVDALLERLQHELAERDAEIARLRGEHREAGPGAPEAEPR